MNEPIFTAEKLFKAMDENELIDTYVPESVNMSREDALKLALERDRLSADELIESVNSSLKLGKAARHNNNSPRVETLLHQLGFG